MLSTLQFCGWDGKRKNEKGRGIIGKIAMKGVKCRGREDGKDTQRKRRSRITEDGL